MELGLKIILEILRIFFGVRGTFGNYRLVGSVGVNL